MLSARIDTVWTSLDITDTNADSSWYILHPYYEFYALQIYLVGAGTLDTLTYYTNRIGSSTRRVTGLDNIFTAMTTGDYNEPILCYPAAFIQFNAAATGAIAITAWMTSTGVRVG